MGNTPCYTKGCDPQIQTKVYQEEAFACDDGKIREVFS